MPDTNGRVASTLLRARFAAKCEIELEPYRGYLQLGAGKGIRNEDYGIEAFESWDEDECEAADPDVLLERLRIEAGTTYAAFAGTMFCASSCSAESSSESAPPGRSVGR